MSALAVDEVLRPFPREASAIGPGLLMSLCVHAAVLTTQVDLPGLLGKPGDPLPAARFEARLVVPAVPAPSAAAVFKPPPRLVSPEPAPAVVTRAVKPKVEKVRTAEVTEAPMPESPLEAPSEASPQRSSVEGDPLAAASPSTASAAVVPARLDADYLHNPRPDYPRLARKRGQQGDVLLEVAVSADGRALEAQVLSSSGHAILDSAARRAVASWRFVPARLGTQTVASTVRVPISFRVVEGG